MRTLLLLAFSFLASTGFAQYYYKDIVGTRESAEIIRHYKQNKVSRVVLNSYDANNTRNDDFYVEQIFSDAANTLKTITRSGISDQSILVSYINEKGQVVKTVDSSTALVSTSMYTYLPGGELAGVYSESIDSSKSLFQSEEHRWEYANGKMMRMVRIKNKKDTSIVQFKLDDAGNVIEEQAIRNDVKSDPVYYYYDDQNRLTDIVRFNNKVRRLLPEYMFEYSASNQVIQKITVPGNGGDYLIWRYQYDASGLKVKEAIFNKQKQLTGKIEYQYQRG